MLMVFFKESGKVYVNGRDDGQTVPVLIRMAKKVKWISAGKDHNVVVTSCVCVVLRLRLLTSYQLMDCCIPGVLGIMEKWLKAAWKAVTSLF